ncbi:MAG TPA: tetratricopeptide repeat protein [Coriobacteriia bacterium]
MDTARFAQGERAYAAGDWRVAAREFLAAVHGAPAEDSGRAYHMAGNSLMKLRRYGDAATVYGHALKDSAYGKRGAVLANLGASLAADGRFDDAAAAYDAALEEPGYDTPWKALQGKGGAYYDMGRYEEAAQAYREASWVEGNTDPGRALNNLGLCYMALDRPEDAVEAFKGAANLEASSARGKSFANLGLAYAAMGFHDEAVRAFEIARDRFAHQLTGPTLSAYEAAKTIAGPQAPAETVEGWSTGELPPAMGESPGEASASGPEGGTAGDGAFFTRTEDEMKEAGREALKAERRERHGGRGLAIRVIVVAGIVVVFVAGIAFAWASGLGYPTQSTTVSGMLDEYRAGRDVTAYWVAVPSTDIKQEVRRLPARFEQYTIDSVDAGPSQSTAHVTVRLDQEATLRYEIWLVREGVGWKVNGIQNDWGSSGGGS